MKPYILLLTAALCAPAFAGTPGQSGICRLKPGASAPPLSCASDMATEYEKSTEAAAAKPDFYGLSLYSNSAYTPSILKFRAGYSLQPTHVMDLSSMSGCSGTYAEDYFYGMSYNVNSSGSIVSVDWKCVDIEKQKIIFSKSQNYAVGVCMDMTYDVTTSTIYGISAVSDVLVTIDASTGEATPYAETMPFYTLSADAAGQLYGIALDSTTGEGVLYSINKITGSALKIGSTGVKMLTEESGTTAYFQTAAFSSANGYLYWAVTTSDKASSLFRVDVATGRASYLSSFPEGETLTSMFEIPSPAAPGAPGAVTDVSADGDPSGALKVEIGFNAPSLQADGNPLGSISSIAIYPSSGEDALYRIDSPSPGTRYTWTDTAAKAGFNVYRIVSANENGESLPVFASAFCGEDYPDAPSNVTVTTDSSGLPLLTWNAPVKGLNGLELDATKLTYTVIRDINGSQETVAEGISTTSYTDSDIDLSVQSYPYYYVKALSAAGEGRQSQPVGTYVGPPYRLPFNETFAGCMPATSPWILQSLDLGGTWELNYISTFPGSGPFDDDGMLVFIGFRSVEGAQARISTPLISFENVESPELKFHFYFLDMADEDLCFNDRMVVEVSVDGGEFKPVENGEYVQHSADTRWTECVLPLKEYAGEKKVAIGFHGYSGGGFDLLLDNIKVHDAGTSLIDSITPEAEEEAEYYNLQGIRVNNPEQGEILIRRCGAKSSKIIIR